MAVEGDGDASEWAMPSAPDPNPDTVWSILMESRLGLWDWIETSLGLVGHEQNGILSESFCEKFNLPMLAWEGESGLAFGATTDAIDYEN